MSRWWVVVILLLAGLVAGGCAVNVDADRGQRDVQARDAATIYPEFTEAWFTPAGDPAANDEWFQILASHGPAHCGWHEVVFLRVAWPLGSQLGRQVGDNEARPFVRDPEGVASRKFAEDTELDATLPEDATFTGYHTEEAQLWLGPDRGSEAVYVVVGDRVERWPRAEQHETYCA